MKRWLMIPVLALLTASSALAQTTGRIAGTVTSEGGQPVPGASVLVVGTGLGTLTAEDGKYLLANVPVGSRQVRVTIIGYTELTRAVSVVAGQTATADFKLTTQAVQLQGIVAVGYGTQQRRNVTGSVASVGSRQIAEIATADPVKAIQGRVAGVEVVSANNLPGASMNIRIRGVRSLTASNDPLYVVDGIPISGGIGDFNPASIQSIEILKDASATAIYGSRGANGVILITTKTGAPAVAGGRQIQFTMDGYAGWQRPLQLVDMMNMDQYVAMLQAAARYAGSNDDVNAVLGYDAMRQAYASGTQTDWQNWLLKTGQQQNFQVGMSGLAGNTRFNLSANYFDQKGLAEGQEYNRGAAVVAVEHNMNRLRLGITANGSRSVQDQGSGDGLWGYALAQTGFGSPYDANGVPLANPDGEDVAVNPARAIAFYRNQFTRSRLFASAFSDLKLVEGVNWRVNFGPDLTHIEHGQFQGPQTTYPKLGDTRGSFGTAQVFNYTLDNLLQVNRDFGTAHHVDATLLYGIQHSRTTADSAAAQALPYAEQLWYNLGSGSDYTIRSNLEEWALQSYMGRMSYTLNGRYTVTGAIRRDGSSRLAPGHKWATFPSVGLSWQLGDEPFMQGISWLSSFKLRGSYGVTGNTAVSPYQTQGALGRVVYSFGSANGYGYGPDDSNPANPSLSWEKTYQTDIGADFSMFNDRVSAIIDVYRQDTKDLLMRRSLPKTSGYSSALQNIGETENKGVEVTLSTVNLQNWNGIRWTMDVSWARNRNKITKLASSDTTGCPVNARPCDLNNGWFVGQPINIGGRAAGGGATPLSPQGGTGADQQRRVFYDYRRIGVWQLGEEAEALSYGTQFKPGEIRLADINGDGRITSADQLIIGNTYPKWTGSVYNRLTWKTFDLSALATIKWGYTLFDQFGVGTNSMQGRLGNIVTDYWTTENPTNDQPAPRLNGNVVPFSSTRGYQDGSHWRVRNITLGYTVSEAFASRLGASSLRVYATAQDPFFFSDYKGYDPENGTSGGAPAYRTLLVGVNAGW